MSRRTLCLPIGILILLTSLPVQLLFAQRVRSGSYFVQEIQVRIPLIDKFPSVILALSFGLESLKDQQNLILAPGAGIILSGTYVQMGDESVGAWGGGVYLRNRIGFKLNYIESDTAIRRAVMLYSTPEISFIKLWGNPKDYAILELATDIGCGIYKPSSDYIFTADLVRLGIRPGQERFLFLSSYPRVGVATRRK